MRRLLRLFLLCVVSLWLAIACRASTSSPVVAVWETGRGDIALTVQTIDTTSSTVTPFVWWEAEAFDRTNFPSSNPFAPQNPTEADVLSAGAWVGIDGRYPETPFLDYTVTLPTAGEYFFYSRKFWHHGPFRWRWDDQPWNATGNTVYLMDNVSLRQFVGANWVALGKVNLAAGTHRLRVELTRKEGAAAFDCFALTATPLKPQGKLKPNQRYKANLADGVLFDPDPDPFAPSPIDLRRLNEAYAGEQGQIQRQGEDFVHSKTKRPVRFWAVNTNPESLYMDEASLAYMARFLAKQGVNMVRMHGKLWAEDDFRTIAPDTITRLHAFVRAMKQEGIYTNLSIYFPVWISLNQDQAFPGYTGQHPFSLLFFNQAFQQIYTNWWRTILTTPDSVTGELLRDEPALAIVELVNEDSTMFWTFQPYETIPEPQMVLLEQQFGTWLGKRYGSLTKAVAAWRGADPVRGDDPAAGRMGIMPLYDITGKKESQRAQDTAGFLADLQRQFFQTAIATLRQTLGYRGLIHASNWVTADARILGPLDKETNTVADFIDRHGYFGGLHEGERASYTLSRGDTYNDRSALLFSSMDPKQKHDFSLPILDIRYNDLPSTISEVNWTLPNRFRADFPLLAAAYGSLQGTDGFFFFATGKHGWEPVLDKFSIASPTIMGQFPATALLYRQGLVQPGTTVADISLATPDIYALKGMPITAPQNLDEFRAQDIPPGQTLATQHVTNLDPLAFLVGKVVLRFTSQPTPSQIANLSTFINPKQKTVRSSTNQLLWNYDRGIVTVDTPKGQGATGFLHQAGTLEFTDIRLTSEMDYGTIVLVALDNKPLATSRQMLLQAMSEEQNLGWRTDGNLPKTIQSVGRAPLAVRNLQGTLALKRADANQITVTALDYRGYPQQAIGTAANISLLPGTFYYLLTSNQ